MLLRDLLDLRFGQCGEIGRLGGDDSLKRLRMMGLQILIQEIDGAAFARSMADQDDRFGMYKIACYLLVVGFFLENMIALEMGFLPMDQMMLESKWIVGLDGNFVFGPAAAEIVINMGGVMVDDHNHSSDLVCLRGFPENARLF